MARRHTDPLAAFDIDEELIDLDFPDSDEARIDALLKELDPEGELDRPRFTGDIDFTAALDGDPDED